MRTFRKWLAVLLLASGVSVVLLIVTIIAVTGLRLRAHLVLLHVTGQLRDVDLSELLRFMRPGSPVQLARLVDTRNPYSAVENDSG